MAQGMRFGNRTREATRSEFWCVYLPQNEGKMRFRAGFALGFVIAEWAEKKCATKKYPAHGSLKGGGPPQDRSYASKRFLTHVVAQTRILSGALHQFCGANSGRDLPPFQGCRVNLRRSAFTTLLRNEQDHKFSPRQFMPRTLSTQGLPGEGAMAGFVDGLGGCASQQLMINFRG